jgi:hypothetical protein
MYLTRFSALCAASVVVCQMATAAPVMFSASGPDAASIQHEVDKFRAALGGLNPNAPENFDGGRRQINWDAAPDAVSDPNAFPGDFFNFSSAPRARGIEFSPTKSKPTVPGTSSADGFQLSSTEASGEPIRFGFGDYLNVFSPERLFAPTGGTVFDVTFFDPSDQETPAAVSGLGIVFANVFDASSAMISLFVEGQDMGVDDPYYSASAEASAGGLSFLGILFDEPVIIGAQVTAGFTSFDQATYGANVVAMDDFIFGEPTASPVPVPASILLLGSALVGGGLMSRRRKTA